MSKKSIKYKGYEIHVEKMVGFVSTIFDENGELVTDESPTLLDTKADSIEDAKEFIDAITQPN